MERAFERWREMLGRVFPEDARIIVLPARHPDEADEWRVLISWRLRGDAQRPHRRSKIVHLVIGGATLQDYASSTSEARQAADRQLEAELRRRLANFDAAHETPPDMEPPRVTWRIDGRPSDRV